MKKIGVIYSHPIFGITKWGRGFCQRLHNIGYPVEAVDLYRGQPFKVPFFIPLVMGKDSKKKINRLAAQFNDVVILEQFSQAEVKLRSEGCTKIVLIGFGLGGVYSLQYAAKREEGFLDGVVAAYPHLLFPDGFPKTPPNLTCVTCPILLTFGEEDTMIEPLTIHYAKKLVREHLDDDTLVPINLLLYRGADHAFTEKHVQGYMRNPFYKKEEARNFEEQILKFLREARKG